MPQPNKIPLAFAASGDKNTIPESTETTGLASWREGFPAITSAPFSEGGVAPKRADFNGIFNALSLAIVWQQQGGFYAYDNATDYEVGNVVLYSGDLYKCLAANGPSSAVKAPTNTAFWAKVILTTATTSAPGYMSATDKAALDSVKDKAYAMVTGELTSLPNDTTTELTSYTFTKPGIYIANYIAIYRTNATGLRTTNISSTSAGSSIDSNAVTVVLAATSGYTFCPIVRIEKITTANTKRYLNGKQNTGSSLNCTGYIYVTRLGDA